MGSWGYGAFENDGASDLIASLARPVDLVLERKTLETARHHYAEARAAAQLIAFAHGRDILGGPSLDRVLEALCRIRHDIGWIAEFRSPPMVAHNLNDEIDAVVARMREGKYGKGRRWPKARWKEIVDKAYLAKSTLVPMRQRRTTLRTRLAASETKRLPKKKARAGRRKR